MTSPIPSRGREESITVFVPGVLRSCCDGASHLPMSAATVRDAFEQIEQRYPKLYRSVCDETGSVRRHINIFINSDNSRDREGLDTPLAAGDMVTILTAVSGG